MIGLVFHAALSAKFQIPQNVKEEAAKHSCDDEPMIFNKEDGVYSFCDYGSEYFYADYQPAGFWESTQSAQQKCLFTMLVDYETGSYGLQKLCDDGEQVNYQTEFEGDQVVFESIKQSIVQFNSFSIDELSQELQASAGGQSQDDEPNEEGEGYTGQLPPDVQQ